MLCFKNSRKQVLPIKVIPNASSPFYFDDQFKFILTTHSISSNTFQSNAVQEIHGLHC